MTKTKKNNYQRNMGTVSSGTMREEDLIPAFLWELRQMKPLKREHSALIRDIEQEMKREDYYSSGDAAMHLNERLFDALDAYALPYFYFGAHPGDGADYGYWLSEDFENNFDGLKVSDLSEVPDKYVGEVLVVNDHGNMTLYYCKRNGCMTEIWGLV